MEKYKNTEFSFEERISDLMSRMTLKEKLMILVETSKANERLGIPKYNHGNEALHGVVRPGKYTVFPQAIAFGATFDDKLIEEIADAISDESRAMHHHSDASDLTTDEFNGRYNGLLTFWSPDLNLCRDPRWGRTGETYGEDPYLAGKIGAAFVRGLQGHDPKYIKAVSTPKHFTANNEEHNRFSCNAKMSEKTLREYHLAPFRTAVKEGKCEAVMAAYNAINDVPCHGSRKLLTDILRDEWGFKGYVVSDCSGIARMWDSHKVYDKPEDAASAALNAGVDLECGSYSPYEHFYLEFLEKQVADGKTTVEKVDEACRRVLNARFKLGQFDPDENVPFSKIPLSVIGCEKHRVLAYKAAAESITLLKNNGVLPLKKDETVAVVGNNAHLCQFGDYSGKPKNTPVSPLDGISAKAGDNCVFAKWSYITREDKYITLDADFLRDKDGNAGLTGNYYDNSGFLGNPKTRTDAKIDFAWRDQMPDSFISTKQYSIRWTGSICPSVTGLHMLRLVYSGSAPCEPPRIIINGKDYGSQTAVKLDINVKNEITVEYAKSDENPVIRLEWLPPKDGVSDPFEEECNAAARCDKVVAVIGLGKEYESEGHDKESLDLPPEQTELLRRLFAVNKNITVVLINGSPMTIPELHKNAAAVIEAWYPGEQGGNALADILYGEANPSGRLCASFPMSVVDLPAFDDYEMTHGRTYLYSKKTPLYPFGFGLSYTKYSYSQLKCEKNGDIYDISVNVQNVGEMAGDEVVQLYLDSAKHSNQPNFRLVRYARIALLPGETKTVRFTLDDGAFTLFDDNGNEKPYYGKFTLYAAGSLPTERSKELGASDFVMAYIDR